MKTLKTIKTVKGISKLEDFGVIIEFDPQEDGLSPFDLIESKEDAEKLCNDYNNGNHAAWFCAKVVVKYKGLEAEDYLGGCSYKSFKEFTGENKGYYVDMINQCIDQINKDIVSNNKETLKNWTIRKAKNLIAPYNLFIVSSNVLHTI
jgi:hypothetical protein